MKADPFLSWLAWVLGATVLVLGLLMASQARSKDNGQFAQSELKPWFDSLQSRRGMCCSFADGRVVEDPDIDTDGKQLRVRIDGEWIPVPDDALVSGANRFGRPLIWPYKTADGKTHIRCFMGGAGI